MRLENSFEVAAPANAAWELLLDVPRVIPCMPGAELGEVVDDSTWKATMRVKLGPVALAFATDVSRDDVDRAGRRVRLAATARELKGRGGGRATIESTLTSVDGGTRVDLVTDLALSGAVAQYGRGIVQDVAGQLVDQFARRLEAELASVPAAAAPAPPTPVNALRLLFNALRARIGRRHA